MADKQPLVGISHVFTAILIAQHYELDVSLNNYISSYNKGKSHFEKTTTDNIVEVSDIKTFRLIY
ncbi:hypothetical protein GCM10008934_30620 [Virgibacillus salarius]